jgi:PKD repeat protein
VNDGFSIEGNVTNATLRNNIGSDNGLFTNGNDLWVDASSTVGFSSDYDVFHRSSASGNTIDYAGAEYTNAADFAAATGHELHGSSANPQLADPAAGDFHPGLGPALDSADASASGFQALDFDGLPPVDLAGVPNTGAGVPVFADRGALERADAAPVAKLRLAPKKGAPGVVVAADGSGSSDDIGIVSYRFAWGDGTPDTVQAGPLATHSFTESGHYKVKLTVTDTAGQTDVHQQPVNVKAPKAKPVKPKPQKDKPAKGKAKGKSRHAKAR